MTTFATNSFSAYHIPAYRADPMNRHTAYTGSQYSQYSQGTLFPPAGHHSHYSTQNQRESQFRRDVEPQTIWTEAPRARVRARSRQDSDRAQARAEAALSRAISKAYAANPGDKTPHFPVPQRQRRPSASGRALKSLSCTNTDERSNSPVAPSVPRIKNLAAKVLAPTNIHGSQQLIEALPPIQQSRRNETRTTGVRRIQQPTLQLPTLANSNLARVNSYPPPLPLEDHSAYGFAPHITTQLSRPRVPPPTKNPTPNNRSTTAFVPPPIVRRPPRQQPHKVHSVPTSPLVWLEDDKMWLNTGDVASNDCLHTIRGGRESSDTRASSAPPRERQDSVDLRMSATFSPGDNMDFGRRISRITVLSVDSAIASRESPSQEERDRKAHKDQRGSDPVRDQFISLMAATAQFTGSVDSVRISRREITTTHNSFLAPPDLGPPLQDLSLSSSALPPRDTDKQRQIPLLQEALLGIDLNIPQNPFSSFRIPRKPLTRISPSTDAFDRSRISHIGVPITHFTGKEAINLPPRARTTGHAEFEFSEEELDEEKRRLGLQGQVSPLSQASTPARVKGQVSVFSPVSSLDIESPMTFRQIPRSPSEATFRGDVSPIISARAPVSPDDNDWSTVSPTSSAQPSLQLSMIPLSPFQNVTVASLWDTLGLTSPTKTVDLGSETPGGGGDVSTFTSISSHTGREGGLQDKESQTNLSGRDGRIVLLRHRSSEKGHGEGIRGQGKKEDGKGGKEVGEVEDGDTWSGDVKWILASRARGLDAQHRRQRSR